MLASMHYTSKYPSITHYIQVSTYSCNCLTHWWCVGDKVRQDNYEGWGNSVIFDNLCFSDYRLTGIFFKSVGIAPPSLLPRLTFGLCVPL